MLDICKAMSSCSFSLDNYARLYLYYYHNRIFTNLDKSGKNVNYKNGSLYYDCPNDEISLKFRDMFYDRKQLYVYIFYYILYIYILHIRSVNIRYVLDI